MSVDVTLHICTQISYRMLTFVHVVVLSWLIAVFLY